MNTQEIIQRLHPEIECTAENPCPKRRETNKPCNTKIFLSKHFTGAVHQNSRKRTPGPIVHIVGQDESLHCHFVKSGAPLHRIPKIAEQGVKKWISSSAEGCKWCERWPDTAFDADW